MRRTSILMLMVLFLLGNAPSVYSQEKIRVVATISIYGDIARYIGQDNVEVKNIVRGDQDAHFVNPKPSYAVWLSQADLYIETGLDLELWAPALIDKSGNPRIRSGQDGYVAAAQGVTMLEVPENPDRSQGDVHIYGNPHIYTSPLNAKILAENITAGLTKVSPENEAFFRDRLQQFKQEIDRRLFGEQLVNVLGADILMQLAESGNLISFLEEKTFRGEPLIKLLDGWMRAMLPLRESKIVAYHKNWVYFEHLFGIDIIGYVEPKPSIPPSPRHVEELVARMRQNEVQIILAANYFDERKVREIARKVGSTAVIVPLSVGGDADADTYFSLVDLWVNSLTRAFEVNL